VTNLYNQALRPHGLIISQMNILVAAAYLGPVKQQDICRVLHVEKSTLSRDLARMRVHGWVTAVPGEDGSATKLSVTVAGTQVLAQAFPAWRQAQEQAKALLGEDAVAVLGRLANPGRASGACQLALKFF